MNLSAASALIAQPITLPQVSRIAALIDFVKNDIAKLIRFAAVSAITVPVGLFVLWLFLQTGMAPVLANLVATSILAIPNYVLNRYWVWNKRGANSVRREIAPFWAMTLLAVLLSTVLVAIADQFTDAKLVFLAANFFAFGVVWVFKFFVLEKFLFGTPATSPETVEASA